FADGSRKVLQPVKPLGGIARISDKHQVFDDFAESRLGANDEDPRRVPARLKMRYPITRHRALVKREQDATYAFGPSQDLGIAGLKGKFRQVTSADCVNWVFASLIVRLNRVPERPATVFIKHKGERHRSVSCCFTPRLDRARRFSVSAG